MAKRKIPAPPKGAKRVGNEERVPVNNEQRMEALQEQKQSMEQGYQKIMGAIELLTAIMEEEGNAKK